MRANPSAISLEWLTNTIPGDAVGCMAAFYNVEHGSTTTTTGVGVPIQSIERAAAILRALAGGSRRLGVSELSERLGLAKGTVHGLLRALQDEGFVEQDPDSGKYQLGGSLLQLGNIYLDVNELRGRSLAWSDNLAIRSGEAVRVGTPHDGGLLVIHHVFRPDNSLQILEVGAHLPLHATALGKAVLAYRPDLEQELVAGGLPQLTRATVTSPAAVGKAMASVRDTGWAAEREEAVIGEASVAAPIFDRRGEAAGAIGVVGPVERIFAGRTPRPELVGSVREAARAISRDLGAGRY
jgi:DNA-binding IclR family transcriptional regulator